MGVRKTPRQVLSKVDALLSKAQKELTELVNSDVKAHSPDAYRVGDVFWEKIERLRWELRDKVKL